MHILVHRNNDNCNKYQTDKLKMNANTKTYHYITSQFIVSISVYGDVCVLKHTYLRSAYYLINICGHHMYEFHKISCYNFNFFSILDM